MKLEIRTRVANARVDAVFAHFNRELFLQLSPPFPASKLLRFDGCKTGDWVEVELLLPLMPQRWLSEITEESHVPGQRHEFVDVGRKLPFFLASWQHRHTLVQTGSDVEIIDAITFTTPFPIPAIFVYPQLKRVFTYRQPVYQRVLANLG